jgi:hypothetical protein
MSALCMALPSASDSYRTYTDQLVYFSARLQADPLTTELAPQVDELLASIDDAHFLLREARRAEIRARARRDQRDEHGDARVRKYNRRLAVLEEARFVRERMFPKGVQHTVDPRGGRTQLGRLEQLREVTSELLVSPRVVQHPEAKELVEVLEGGKQLLDEIIAELGEVVEHWEQQSRELGRARDLFEFRRHEGVGTLGAVLGELRVLVGGSSKKAYGYTQPARTRNGGKGEAVDELEDEAEALG